MKRILSLGIFLLCLLPLSAQVVPQPNGVTLLSKNEHVLLPLKTLSFASEKDFERAGVRLTAQERADLAEQFVAAYPSLRVAKKTGEIRLVPATADVPAEGYGLTIGADARIVLSARTAAGFFYGLQTLRQLGSALPNGQYVFPLAQLNDAPRFGWRGQHLDVARHFFDKEFVKKQLRVMAQYKLNTFHWHLTDSQGWRIEIKRYPQLTAQTAYRTPYNWTEWTRGDQRFCTPDAPGAGGGYYTQDDIREVVEYARRLHITVVPEIDVPGHSWAALSVFPELGCTGKPYVNHELCPGKEATYTFIENVLTEVMALFPSRYIHIGGDEADRRHWEDCPDCRARRQQEHLKDVRELQSYMTHRLETFLEKHGRRLLGWDEILEGGLSPNATVMSWRGEQGGIDAALSGHDAVMVPGDFCYLDNAQDDPTVEPRGIGGYLPIETVYGYDPVSPRLSGASARHILGVQGNLWTEFIERPEHIEYMLYPRLLAIAEVGWTQPAGKDYRRFRGLALREVERLRAAGYHPFDLAHERGGRPEAEQPVASLAKGAKVVYNGCSYPAKYAAGGDTTLVDGWRGGFRFIDGRWQGFEDQDFDVTLDLGRMESLHSVSAEFLHSPGPWIFLPKGVSVSFSTDGKTFTAPARIANPVSPDEPLTLYHTFRWTGSIEARYIRLHADKDGRPGAWLFIDEIWVE